MPLGPEHPQEGRLNTFTAPVLVPHRTALKQWWLGQGGGNTPNWDIAVACKVNGEDGLVLVEAKANVQELKAAGKWQDAKASAESRRNHDQIGRAIALAAKGLSDHCPGIELSHKAHYQLSNRIAFAWKLASLGVPTVLVYLGFLGDQGICDAGEPLVNDEQWQKLVGDHLEAIHAEKLLNGPVAVGASKFWLTVRSREVQVENYSPERVPRGKVRPAL